MTDMTLFKKPGYTLCKDSSSDKGQNCSSCSRVTLTDCYDGQDNPRINKEFNYFYGYIGGSPVQYVGFEPSKSTVCGGIVVREAGPDGAASAVCEDSSCEK
ncbi:hypothetical protein CROQUDRAFT_103334 [Cronartium quercuum f. sp. fusiforme G11]|uniref:Uncharacterized protein n=1 Tax=Cronartium quercuum f. sp. fusiforme G11 TaxID=708437 RepID=A0A9P6NU53_9BASI|nr:hypothetical protein CROQUDRAFT_103334 [Cronartium quercuum f. sp. fusiforme G11]